MLLTLSLSLKLDTMYKLLWFMVKYHMASLATKAVLSSLEYLITGISDPVIHQVHYKNVIDFQ